MRRPGPISTLLLCAAFAAAISGPAGTAWPGDAVVAKTLLDGGKKAVNAKKYDEAITMLRKAVAEDPSLVEAVYWRAQAHEKLKDNASALAAYREFLDLCSKKAGGPSTEDQKLKLLAEKRVEALAVADKEFRKLEEKYVADLLALAKAKVAGDPGAALAAANRVLEVSPKNAEALALRDRLGEKTNDGPFAGVASWRDFVKDRSFKSEIVKFPGDLMSIEMKEGSRFRTDPPCSLGADHAGEMEFRAAEVFDPEWRAGFTLGETKEGHFVVLLAKAQVRVEYTKPKQRPEGFLTFAIPPLDPGAWHRLGFAVHGARINVFLDGQQVIDDAQGVRSDFAGDFGIAVLGCRAEFRMVRAGDFK